ncbi:MAG: exopolysaccharide biosynthesis polyprenyl glycosylphosphotransferase [Pseudomonadota bacterium]
MLAEAFEGIRDLPDRAAFFAAFATASPFCLVMAGAFAPKPVRDFGHGMLMGAVGVGARSKEAAGRIDLAAVNDNDIEKRIRLRAPRPAQWSKRFFDVFAALGLLIFLAPLLLVTALAIGVDSKGPILYRQRRIGFRGEEFEIFKFRSMRTDAEKDGARWAAADDSRVTRVGRFIRRTRIDEIPQAINILRGEMSFVGPRPERPEFVTVLEKEIPHYHERHLVKPGITGWAQVKHEYTASIDGARTKLTYDLFYIKHFSLLLDLLIVLMTVRVALLGIGSR